MRSGSGWGSGWRRRRGVSSSNPSRRDPRLTIAGIAKGDELLALDGQPVKEPVDVLFRVGGKREGDTARVTVRRGGEEKTLDLTFFQMPKPKGH